MEMSIKVARRTRGRRTERNRSLSLSSRTICNPDYSSNKSDTKGTEGRTNSEERGREKECSPSSHDCL